MAAIDLLNWRFPAAAISVPSGLLRGEEVSRILAFLRNEKSEEICEISSKTRRTGLSSVELHVSFSTRDGRELTLKFDRAISPVDFVKKQLRK